MNFEGTPAAYMSIGSRYPYSTPDYWCHTCNRGAEGCNHHIEEK